MFQATQAPRMDDSISNAVSVSELCSKDTLLDPLSKSLFTLQVILTARFPPLTMPLVSDHWALWCLFPSIVVSLALNAAPDGLNLLTPVRPLGRPSFSNISSTIFNSTSLGDDGPGVHCDDALYGNPPVASCREAVNLLPRDARAIISPAVSIGPRGEGTHWDISLPHRVISCTHLFSLRSTRPEPNKQPASTDSHDSRWEMHH